MLFIVCDSPYLQFDNEGTVHHRKAQCCRQLNNLKSDTYLSGGLLWLRYARGLGDLGDELRERSLLWLMKK